MENLKVEGIEVVNGVNIFNDFENGFVDIIGIRGDEDKIGRFVKSVLCGIKSGEGICLNELGKVIMEKFGLDMTKAYMRVNVLFKGGVGQRGWCKHLTKMKGGAGNYVYIVFKG